MTVHEATTEPARGNSFGKYRLLASVGHGGMADVYLAVAAGPAGVTKLQVVKRLRQNLAEEPDFLAMFLDEARLASRLNHPNVVQTNEVGQVDSGYFIAMEYLDGQPLNRILHAGKTRPAPPGLCLQIVAEALAGLHYAHELTDYDGTPSPSFIATRARTTSSSPTKARRSSSTSASPRPRAGRPRPTWAWSRASSCTCRRSRRSAPTSIDAPTSS